MTAVIAGAGTSEQVWLPFLSRLAPPALDLDPTPARVLVAAPHPDDEVLGVGGLMSALASRGSRVEVVAVTDGGASHPGSTAVLPGRLTELRVAEVAAALAVLGLAPPVLRLGRPDGGAQGLEGPTFEALAGRSPGPRDWLLAPWSGDGHPDHEAVGRAAERVARVSGARLLAYPVWAWHWAGPGAGALPWQRARAVPLPSAMRSAKAAAVACFRTQTAPLGPAPEDGPVLSPAVLARFARPFELVFDLGPP